MSTAVVEADAEAEHEIVWGLELLKAVADVEKDGVRDIYFEEKHLVERLEVAAAVEDVGSETDADSEDGHDELGAGGEAEGDLGAEGRVEKAVGGGGVVSVEFVGAGVVDHIEGGSGAKLADGGVHDGKPGSEDGVGTGGKLPRTVVLVELAPPRAKGDDVVDEAGAEGREGKRRAVRRRGGGGRGKRTDKAEPRAEDVDPAVGEAGVAVGEMGKVDARLQPPAGGEPPIEMKVGVDVGVDAGADGGVVRIGVRIVRTPSPREAEVPLVVEGKEGGQADNAGALEKIGDERRAQLAAVAERIEGETGTLVGSAIKAVGGGTGRGGESVLEVAGGIMAHGLARLIATREEIVSGKESPSPEFEGGGTDEAARRSGGRRVGAEGGFPGRDDEREKRANEAKKYSCENLFHCRCIQSFHGSYPRI